MEYKEKLKDPRWQKKRLKIMERDDWQCQCCFDRIKPKIVHHKFYLKDKEPWEYNELSLITLCEDCHKSIHEFEKTDCNWLDCNYTDQYIIQKRIIDIINQQGIYPGILTINQILIAQTIKEDEI